MTSIRERIAALKYAVHMQTAVDIAGLMGVDDPDERDIKDLERILKSMGLKSKWTRRAGVHAKVWFNPAWAMRVVKKPDGKLAPRRRVKKRKLTPRVPAADHDTTTHAVRVPDDPTASPVHAASCVPAASPVPVK